MMKNLLWAVLLFAFSAAQQNAINTPFLFGTQSNFSNNIFPSTYYFNSRIYAKYKSEKFNLNFHYYINQDLPFSIKSNKLISLEDGVSLSDVNFESISVPNDEFLLERPVRISASYLLGKFQIRSSLDWYRESFSEFTGSIRKENENLIFETNELHVKQNSFYSSSLLAYHFSDFELAFGYEKARFFKSTTDSIPYQFKPKSSPYFSFSYRDFHSEATLNRIKVAYHFNELFNLASHYLDIESSYQLYHKQQNFHQVKFLFRYPFTKYFNLELGFSQNLAPSSFQSTNIQSFDDMSDILNSSIPHDLFTKQTISLALTYKIAGEKEILKPSFEEIAFTEETLFSYKKPYYAYNPSGRIRLKNPHKVPIFAQFDIHSSKENLFYSTELIRLNPNEEKQIPIYLYLFDNAQFLNDIDDQLILDLRLQGERFPIKTIPIKILSENTWDGTVSHLKYFIDSNNPTLKSYLNRLDNIDSKQDFDLLKFILNHFGKDIQYVDDPIQKSSYDYVRFAENTLLQKKGDCEDLVVLFASLLLNKGFECQIVDLKASDKTEGHVFLLVDTHLKANEVASERFNEFNSVVRKNRFDEFTIWIPIESTVLNQGFEKALKRGATQYYNRIINSSDQNSYELIELSSND